MLVDDADLDGDTLRDACDLLFDERRATMSVAARRLGRPGAARCQRAAARGRWPRAEPLPSQAELDATQPGPAP